MPEVLGHQQFADRFFRDLLADDSLQAGDEFLDLLLAQALQGAQVGEHSGPGGAALLGVPVALGDLQGLVLLVSPALPGDADKHRLHYSLPYPYCQ
ncbi:MAG TPA: hypothetical protein VJ161_12910 [Geobacteraceae bacterium]|nr:hypothetical protein [Geobacteraceae bacterium]